MAHKDSYLNNMITVMQRHYVKHGSERWACPTLPTPPPWSPFQYYTSASDWWPWIVTSVTVIADTIKHANGEVPDSLPTFAKAGEEPGNEATPWCTEHHIHVVYMLFQSITH